MIAESVQLLEQAEKALRTADHMIYITYPLIKENRLLKAVLEQLYGIADSIMKAILYHEYAFKRIQAPPSSSASQNLESFRRCAANFDITGQELEQLKALIELMARHRSSNTEFIRRDRLVLMSSNARTESIGFEQLKSYLNSLKIVLQRAKSRIMQPRLPSDRYK